MIDRQNYTGENRFGLTHKDAHVYKIMQKENSNKRLCRFTRKTTVKMLSVCLLI